MPAMQAAGREFGVIVRGGGLGSLLHLILGQQVSVDAAAAMYRRLVQALKGDVTPEGLLGLDDDSMRRCGFSRQKAGYARGLARAMIEGSLDLAVIDGLPDRDVADRLVAFKGVGVWTAECYLVFGLGRRDVFPAGDLAIQIGWQELDSLPSPPTAAEMREIATGWSPHRTAAAWLLWHFYLANRGRRMPP